MTSCKNSPTNNSIAQEDTLDVKTIKFGDTTTINFVLQNKNLKNIHIEDIKTSCGCTVVKNNITNLKPLSTTILSILYKPDSFDIGHKFLKTIILRTDDTEPLKFLYVKGFCLK
jgi:hypothetical protein